jgi:hypothetical protein
MIEIHVMAASVNDNITTLRESNFILIVHAVEPVFNVPLIKILPSLNVRYQWSQVHNHN